MNLEWVGYLMFVLICYYFSTTYIGGEIMAGLWEFTVKLGVFIENQVYIYKNN